MASTVPKAAHPRAGELSMNEMENYFSGKLMKNTKSVSQAMELALQNTQVEDIILVAGSVFVVGEAREFLFGTKYAANK